MIENPTRELPNGKAEEVHAAEARVLLHYPEEKRFSFYDVLLVLVENRRLIGWCVLASTLFALVLAVIPDEPDYVAGATVVREAHAEPAVDSRLSSLSSMFGVVISGGSTGLNADAYPDVLMSKDVRHAVVRDSFYVSRLGRSILLADYLNEPDGLGKRFLNALSAYTIGLPKTIQRIVAGNRRAPETARAVAAVDSTGNRAYPTLREERAMEDLMDMVIVEVDKPTGLMHVTATTNDSRLSADLVGSFLSHFKERVDAFYTEKGRQNLEFIEGRFEKAEGELRAAEERLAEFLYRNASIGSSQLQTETARLQREVEFKSQLYSSLQQQRTQAEMDLQRSKPVITVVEEPVPPMKPLESNPAALLFFGLVFGGVLGVGLAFTRWFVDVQNSNEEERTKRERIVSSLNRNTLFRRVMNGKRV